MKKNIWIWALAATFMVACSSNDDEAIIQDPVTEDDWVGQNGQVVIQLGGGESPASANTAVSRAPITDNNFTNSDPANPTTTVGIFALATDATAWTNTDGILLNNIKGVVTNQERAAADGADVKEGKNPYKITLFGTDVSGANGKYGAVYYYPMKVNYNYSFYGYAPHQSTVNVTADNSTVTFNALDGSQDVLWQKAEAKIIAAGSIRLDTANATTNSTALSGYNAKYIRQLKYHNEIVGTNETNYSWVPNIKFDHKLTQLKFQVIAAKQQSTDDKKAAKLLTVKDIKIINHGYKATLDYVSGDLTWPDITGENLEMRNINNGAFEDTKATSDYKPEDTETPTVRGYLLAKPAASYQLQLTIIPPNSTTNPSPTEQIVTLTLENKTASGENQFKPGHSYNIQIGIYAMQEAMVDATLSKWVDHDEPIYTPVE